MGSPPYPNEATEELDNLEKLGVARLVKLVDTSVIHKSNGHEASNSAFVVVRGPDGENHTGNSTEKPTPLKAIHEATCEAFSRVFGQNFRYVSLVCYKCHFDTCENLERGVFQDGSAHVSMRFKAFIDTHTEKLVDRLMSGRRVHQIECISRTSAPDPNDALARAFQDGYNWVAHQMRSGVGGVVIEEQLAAAMKV